MGLMDRWMHIMYRITYLQELDSAGGCVVVQQVVEGLSLAREQCQRPRRLLTHLHLSVVCLRDQHRFEHALIEHALSGLPSAISAMSAAADMAWPYTSIISTIKHRIFLVFKQ